MDVTSLSSTLGALVSRAGSSEPGSVQQAAQVSVLKQANDAQAQAALALISGIGQKLDARG